MPEPVPPFVHRGLWLLSASLLLAGTIFLVFGLGWSLVASTAALGSGALPAVSAFGWNIFGGSCLAILAGVVAYSTLRRLESGGGPVVEIDFPRPIVGLHGRRSGGRRCRVEARITVMARRAVTGVVLQRADEITRTAAEALAYIGPRAAHHSDRALAERAITEVVNRSLRARVVRSVRMRSVRIHRIGMLPAP